MQMENVTANNIVQKKPEKGVQKKTNNPKTTEKI